MYKNLELEIFVSGIPKKEIAEKLGITYPTFLLKLSGKSYFTLDEAKKLKEILKSDKTIEVLFETAQETA